MDLGEWLRSLGLEQYEATFRENAVNEEVLPNLSSPVSRNQTSTSLATIFHGSMSVFGTEAEVPATQIEVAFWTLSGYRLVIND